MIENIKNKLNSKFEEIINDLSEEELMFAKSFKNASLLEKMIELFSKDKSVNTIKTLSLSFLNHNKIEDNLKDKNKELFLRLCLIENSLLFQKLIKKYFIEDDFFKDFSGFKNLKDSSEFYIFNLDDNNYKIIQFNQDLKNNKNLVKNPYNNKLLLLSFNFKEGNKINSDISYIERTYNSHIKIDQFNILGDIVNYKEKSFSNLKSKFKSEKLLDFYTEYVLYHEFAHAAITNKIRNKNQSEIFSDICGIISVIKNNDLNKEDSINFTNYIIGDRASQNTITFEINSEISPIHATQVNLSILKQWLKEDFDFIKNSTKEEEIVIAEDLASLNMDKIVQNDLSISSSIFTLLNGWKNVLDKSDTEVSKASEILNKKGLKDYNISNLFFSYYYLKDDFESMYNYYPVSGFKSKILLNILKDKMELFKKEIEEKCQIVDGFKNITNEKLTKINKLRL